MSAKYLIRFDDICPTMNWEVFSCIESLLDLYNIKPILAVVPDNLDPKLIVGLPALDFWARVRRWQAKGWSIALHGYQHHFETLDAGLVGLNSYSEFSGLPKSTQRQKLVNALEIFSKHDVHPDVWIAPAHSFDKTTVNLLLELGINVISDGLYFRPVRWLGALFVPQQLWKLKHMPFGLWTVCYHHNGFTNDALRIFEADIKKFASSITSMNEFNCSLNAKPRNILDVSFACFWKFILRSKGLAKKILRRALWT